MGFNANRFSADESKNPDKFNKLIDKRRRLKNKLLSGKLNGEQPIFEAMINRTNDRLDQLAGLTPSCRQVQSPEKIAAKQSIKHLQEIINAKELAAYDENGNHTFYSLKQKISAPRILGFQEELETEKEQLQRISDIADSILLHLQPFIHESSGSHIARWDDLGESLQMRYKMENLMNAPRSSSHASTAVSIDLHPNPSSQNSYYINGNAEMPASMLHEARAEECLERREPAPELRQINENNGWQYVRQNRRYRKIGDKNELKMHHRLENLYQEDFPTNL